MQSWVCMRIKEKVLVIPSWMQIYEKRIKFFIVITGLDLSRALVASEAFPLLASRKKGEKKKKSHLSSSLSFSLCSLRASSSARLYAVFKRSLLILLLDPLLRFQAFLSPKTRTLGYHLPIRFFGKLDIDWLLMNCCCWWHQVEIGFSVLYNSNIVAAYEGYFHPMNSCAPYSIPCWWPQYWRGYPDITEEDYCLGYSMDV